MTLKNMHFHHKVHQNNHHAYFTIYAQHHLSYATINQCYDIQQTITIQQMHIHKHSIMLFHRNINTSLDKHNDTLINHTCHHKHRYIKHLTITQTFHQALP